MQAKNTSARYDMSKTTDVVGSHGQMDRHSSLLRELVNGGQRGLYPDLMLQNLLRQYSSNVSSKLLCDSWAGGACWGRHSNLLRKFVNWDSKAVSPWSFYPML
jgi:hypothetical protein